MSDRASFLGLDYSKERTKTGIYLATLTAANFDVQQAALNNLQVGIQSVSLIAYDGKTYPSGVVARESVPAADSNAQREAKWLVNYVDNANGRKGNFEIGGADTSLLVLNSDLMDISAGTGATFVTIVETNAVSRDDNAITVIDVRYVGRTL